MLLKMKNSWNDDYNGVYWRREDKRSLALCALKLIRCRHLGCQGEIPKRNGSIEIRWSIENHELIDYRYSWPSFPRHYIIICILFGSFYHYAITEKKTMTSGSDRIDHRRSIDFTGIWSVSTASDDVYSSLQGSHCTHCKRQVAFNTIKALQSTADALRRTQTFSSWAQTVTINGKPSQGEWCNETITLRMESPT